MCPIRNLQGALIRTLQKLSQPRQLNSRQNRPPILRSQNIRHRLRRKLASRVENPRITSIERHLTERDGTRAAPLLDAIASLLANELEDVSADVVAAEGMQIPVRFNGAQFRVVVVEAGVGGSFEMGRHGVAEEDGEDAVGERVACVLVEGDQDEGVGHEALVGEEGLEEAAEEVASYCYGGVVAVGGHVGRDEDPLGEFVVLEIFEEEGCVFDLFETVGSVCY